MAASSKQFERWNPDKRTSWAWRVFKKHDAELSEILLAHDLVKRKTYKSLKDDGAQWADPVTKHFVYAGRWESEQFSNLQAWSNSYNEFSNWNNLNAALVLASNLETFIATIVRLAIESDPGVLFGATKSIDGVTVLKSGSKGSIDVDEIVESMVRGDWQSRHNSYVKVFAKSPRIFSKNISKLERLRTLRNEVAHSFGRNIEQSRRNGQVTTLKITSISRKKLEDIRKLTWNIARSIDTHLQYFHIGAYQSIAFYHELQPSLRMDVHPSIRAAQLKTSIGRHGDSPWGKTYCKGLVNYYEAL